MKSTIKTISVFSFLILSFNLKAQINVPGRLEKSVENQSFNNFKDSLNNIHLQMRGPNNEISQQEKFYNRWLDYYQDRSYYPGVQQGGDLNWKSVITPIENSYCNSGPSNAIWQFVDLVPSPIPTQNIGVAWSVASSSKNSIDTLYVGTVQAGLFKSSNSGQDWENITDYMNIPQMGVSSIAINPNNSNHIVIATKFNDHTSRFSEDYSILYSLDAGATWSFPSFNGINNEDFIHDVKFNPTNPNELIACGGNKILKSTDGGVSWNLVFDYVTSEEIDFSDIEFSLANSSHIMVSSLWTRTLSSPPVSLNSGAKLFSSIDNGLTWIDRTPGDQVSLDTANNTMEGSGAIAIDVTPADPNSFYALHSDGFNSLFIKKSSDNGVTWTTIDQSLRIHYDSNEFVPKSVVTTFGANRHEFEVSDLNDTTFYGGGNVMSKKSGGSFWQNITSYSPAYSTHADIRSIYQLNPMGGEDRILMGNDGGISFSSNSGIGWSNQNGTGLSITHIKGLTISQKDNIISYGATHVGLKKRLNNQWYDLYFTDGEWCETSNIDSTLFWARYDAIGMNDLYSSSAQPVYNTWTEAIGKLGRKFTKDPNNERNILDLQQKMGQKVKPHF